MQARGQGLFQRIRIMTRPALAALLLAAAGCAEAAPPAPPLPAADIRLIDRVTWGATPADIAEYRRLGRAAWLEAQLTSPATEVRLPDAIRPLYDALADPQPIGETVASQEMLRYASVHAADKTQGAEARLVYATTGKDLRFRAVRRSLIRDIYSRDQLREQLTWFWFNHFNIKFVFGSYSPLATDYEERTIRPRALGRFCDLVGATLRHPAMLVYLNNAQSKADKINENYARELLELHTMGVGGGYSQQDVQQLARVLTGATVDIKRWPPPPAPRGGVRDGLFLFDPFLHDGGKKTLLGQTIDQKGMAGIDQATAILCRQPVTATRIARKLAVYFVADEPPPALVERMAAAFTASDGDIAAVLRVMFAAPEFTASLGKLYKDPNHYVVSAARLAFQDRPIVDAWPLNQSLERLGQGRFSRATPDGYPLESANWNASGQLDQRFSFAAQLGRGMPTLFIAPGTGPAGTRGEPPPLQAILAASGIHADLAPATRQALAGANGAADWNALFLSSPEFMRR